MGKRTVLILYLLFCICIFSTNDERLFGLLYKKISILEFKIFMIEPINVNIKNMFGWTPLMITSGFYSDPDFCDVLLKNGARVNERDLNGWTPVFFSCAFNENYMVTDLLIRKKADINIQDIYGNSPIFYAVQNNRYDTVSLLIQSSAQLNFSNFEGSTLLDICYEKNIEPEMKKLLISAGARKSILDPGNMIKVQGASFEMGDVSKLSYSDEKPLRKILL
ncbi:MAG TPA: ankyrin repeat domain-containing protein, partial [Petrotogaceae bacterium]|nr:ankyrin repeat domain-containing protein [Petrotogaceae bacterium]